MLRVSVTTLESFRRVLETQYGNETELIASVKGEPFPVTWQMAAGTAWQKVLEEPDKCRKSEQRSDGAIDSWFESGGYAFSPEAVAAAIDRLGPGEVEVKATLAFQTAHGPATLVAKADHVHGSVITDNKFKASTPDARDYENSVQWRAYLLVHCASCFRYLLYDFADPKDGYCELKNILSFKFWRYADLEDDLLRWLNLFLSWCAERGLLWYLERAGTL